MTERDPFLIPGVIPSQYIYIYIYIHIYISYIYAGSDTKNSGLGPEKSENSRGPQKNHIGPLENLTMKMISLIALASSGYDLERQFSFV